MIIPYTRRGIVVWIDGSVGEWVYILPVITNTVIVIGLIAGGFFLVKRHINKRMDKIEKMVEDRLANDEKNEG